jgi:hypothetical protein
MDLYFQGMVWFNNRPAPGASAELFSERARALDQSAFGYVARQRPSRQRKRDKA